tara:strand:+ start:168 stop:344 length:177 start_codon:yes stop_codon:yes gene_type:complete
MSLANPSASDAILKKLGFGLRIENQVVQAAITKRALASNMTWIRAKDSNLRRRSSTLQ